MLARTELNSAAWGPAAADFGDAEKDANLTKQERFQVAHLNRELLARVRPTVQHECAAAASTREHSGRAASRSAPAHSETAETSCSCAVSGTKSGLVTGASLPRRIPTATRRKWHWRLTRRGFYGEVTAGGSDQSGMFGAAVGRYDLPGPGWELRFRSNERATDSLLLMALGGVQDSVSLNYRHRVSELAAFSARRMMALMACCISLVAEHHGAQHHVFAEFLGFGFHHHHGVMGAGDDQFQLGIGHVVDAAGSACIRRRCKPTRAAPIGP